MTCASCARHVAITVTIEPGIVRGRLVDAYRLCVRCFGPGSTSEPKGGKR